MILSDREIKKALKGGLIVIDPAPTEEQYTTSAVDLYLGDEILELVPEEELRRETGGVEEDVRVTVDPTGIDFNHFLDRFSRPAQKEGDGSYLLPPHKFILGRTQERIELPRDNKIAARVEGRSTLARLGLVVHFTAPTIHAGFRGRIILEMCNFGNYRIRLRPGLLPICQLIFERLGKKPTGPIKTKFQNQKGIRPQRAG